MGDYRNGGDLMKYIKHLIYYGIFKYYKWIIDRSDKKIKKLECKLRVEKGFNEDMTKLILKHIEDMQNIL